MSGQLTCSKPVIQDRTMLDTEINSILTTNHDTSVIR